MSIFGPLSSKSSIFRNFWIEVPELPSKQHQKKAILRKPLTIPSSKSGPLPVQVTLTENSVFYVSPQETILLAYVKWCVLSSFREEDENGNIKFGFNLKSSFTSQDFYTPNEEDLNIWVTHLSYLLIMADFEDYYVILKRIDSGQFGTVYLCQDLDSNSLYAVKRVSKSILQRPKSLNLLYNEINIQRKLDHPNIVKLFKVFEDREFVYLVMEYVKEGNLFKRISSAPDMSEREVMIFCQNLFRTLEYIHGCGIIHRDLKPENILLQCRDSICSFKIADFGLACYIKDHERSCCGSPGYIAPEMLKGAPYNSKADIFSAGVISFILLTGFTPFGGSNTKETISKNLKCKIQFTSSLMKTVNPSAKNFLKKVLNPDPDLRHSASEVIQNDWFKIRKYSESDTVSTTIKVEGARDVVGFG